MHNSSKAVRSHACYSLDMPPLPPSCTRCSHQVHSTKPKLRAKRVWSVLPDLHRFANHYVHVVCACRLADAAGFTAVVACRVHITITRALFLFGVGRRLSMRTLMTLRIACWQGTPCHQRRCSRSDSLMRLCDAQPTRRQTRCLGGCCCPTLRMKRWRRRAKCGVCAGLG